MCTVLLPPGDNPIAVNKYIIPYHNLSHWNCNEKLKEKFGSYTRKTFDRFTKRNNYTWNITHNTESTEV